MVLAVPSQRTWTVSDLETAALFNSNIRDAVNFLLNPPLFVGDNSAAQSIANGAGVTVAVTWDTNIVDTYSGHSTVTNPSRYTAQVAGWYDVTASIAFTANGTGGRSAEIFVNGAGLTYTRMDQVGSAASGTVLQVSCPVQLAVGDYTEIKCGQTSGGALTLNASQSNMSVLWIHA